MRIFKRLYATLFLMIFLVPLIHAEEITGRKCTTCGKVISDKRFSAVMEEGAKVRYFDDIGCAVQYLKGKCPIGSKECDFTVRVFDYDTVEPVHIRAAYYVQSSKIRTPDGSGIVAFKEKKHAESFLKANGLKDVLDFEDLK